MYGGGKGVAGGGELKGPGPGPGSGPRTGDIGVGAGEVEGLGGGFGAGSSGAGVELSAYGVDSGRGRKTKGIHSIALRHNSTYRLDH